MRGGGGLMGRKCRVLEGHGEGRSQERIRRLPKETSRDLRGRESEKGL